MPEASQITDGFNMSPEEAGELNALLDADEAADAASAKEESSPQPEEGPSAETERPPSEPEGTQDIAPTEEEKPGTPDDSKPKDDKPTEGEQKPDDTAKSKEEKELERRDRSWKKLNEDKEALKLEREQVEAEKARIQKERELFLAQQQQSQQPKYTAKEYEDAAVQFENEGNYEMADKARKRAEEVRRTPSLEAQAKQFQQTQEFNRAQGESWRRVAADFPEMLDKSSSLRTRVDSFLNENPRVLSYTDGPHLAVQFVKNRDEASRVPELSKQVEQLQGRIKELEQATSLPGGSVPNPSTQERDFEDLSLSEMERQIESDMRTLQ